jgi:hypothetical protein
VVKTTLVAVPKIGTVDAGLAAVVSLVVATVNPLAV